LAGLFAIGRILKPHGLKGCMKGVSYLESDERFGRVDEVFLGEEKGEGHPFKVENLEIKKKGFLLKLQGIEDAGTAGRWAGAEVLADSSLLEKLPDGEYYWRDLIGLHVYSEEGNFLGKIEAVFPTGSNDVYVCAGGEREILLPAIADVIQEVDTGKGLMVVRLLKGL
jgi:16S rRNA processing protein RimM